MEIIMYGIQTNDICSKVFTEHIFLNAYTSNKPTLQLYTCCVYSKLNLLGF